MNKQIFATLLVLALATAVVAKRPAFIQVKPAVMKHVRETPVSRSTDILSKFHSTLTLVQTSQDAAEGNVLQEWISDFRQSVVEEGIAHANIHAEQVQDCADEIPFRNKEINDATVSKQNAEVQYAACVQDQGLTNSLVQVNTAAQQKYNADLDNAREERIRQKALYETRVKAHGEAEVTIGEAIVIVDQFATTVHTGANYNAFVQLGKKVNALLMTSMKTGHVRLVTPITTMFLQTKQNAFDPEVIDRLRVLFEELLANVQSSLGQLNGDEDNAASAFAQYEAHLTGLIDKLEAEEEALEFHGVEMARCIETEANVAVAAENKFDRNVDLLKKAEVLCASYEAQWEAAESSRAGQLKMIDALGRAAEQIQQIYPNKFKSLGAALQNAGDAFNTETDQYNDSDPFEEYRQAGAALKVGA